MSKHNRDRKKLRPIVNPPKAAPVHVNAAKPLPIVSVHDIRRAPAGTVSGGLGPIDLTALIKNAQIAEKFDEPPSRQLGPIIYGEYVNARFKQLGGNGFESWECDPYYGSVRRYADGFPIGGGPFVVIGVSNFDESARHDWRDLQQLKNLIAGEEWEAVELYPAESRLTDPSNRFYLWCVPKNVFNFGFVGRHVLDRGEGPAPQRPFPKYVKPEPQPAS